MTMPRRWSDMMPSAWLNICWLMTGGWVMLSEKIQLPLSFQRLQRARIPGAPDWRGQRQRSLP
jgi:hypothetical protein